MIHDTGIGFDMDERGVKAAVKYTTSTLLSGRCSMNHIASCFAGHGKAIGVFDNNLHLVVDGDSLKREEDRRGRPISLLLAEAWVVEINHIMCERIAEVSRTISECKLIEFDRFR